MIDAEKNIIYFGYGDIAVGSAGTALHITPFKPPQEIGSIVDFNVVEKTGEAIKFYFSSLREICKFQDTLYFTNSTDNRFTFQGYIFDFTHYDEKSKAVLEFHINRIRNQMIALMAC